MRHGRRTVRPHRLRLTAFGPFAGTVEVDLDALAGNGLFLLHGETGAGKTTLLDGLGFALYGTVPGERQKAKRLRSDHAPADLRTSVQLEATLAGRRLRITRSPVQERRKTRGEGVTTEQAKVLLEEHVAGRWSTVSTRIDEAAAELDPLLGMSAEQFFQVVLLPQGEFAQFLRAKSDKRGELLEQLFGTARFGAVEDWLIGRRIATGRDVEAGREQLELLLARLDQAASVGEPAPADGAGPDPGPGDDPVGWARSLLAEAEGRAAARRAGVERAELVRRDSRASNEAAEQLLSRQRRRASAVHRSVALAGQAPSLAALGKELRAAGRAAGLQTAFSDLTTRTSAATAAATAEQAARAELPGAGLPGAGAHRDAPPALLRDRAQAFRERSGALDGLRGVADALAEELAVVAAATEEAALAGATAARCAAQLDELPARLQRAQAAVDQARAAAVQLPATSAELARLEVAVADGAARAGARAERATAAAALLAARERLVALQEQAQQVREARFDAMVYELAATLVRGEPCFVCGSLEHPDPSEVQGERVGRDDEELARAKAAAAAGEVSSLHAKLAAIEATLAGLDARLLDVGPETLADRVVALAGELGGLSRLLDGGDAADRAWAELQATQADLERERAAAAAEQLAAQRRADEATVRAVRSRDRLAAELGGSVDLDAAIARVAAEVQGCDAAAAAAEAADRARAELVRAELALRGATSAAGFADPDQARSAGRTSDWVEATEQQLRAHADELAGVTAQLADPDLDVPLEPPADVHGAQLALTAADEVLAAALELAATARERVRAVGLLVPELTAALAALAPREERAASVRRLADLCTGAGQNTLKMSLSSFVLAARLEQVALAASSRLLRMSQGRYSLVHTDASSRGGARSGLGLLARDTWTGQDRETSTLSGGETFLASLALALGLADVVATEAGGGRIDALFVDEGFGTLDEDTLDEVMDVLDGLRDGGRVVGLVSHVAELRQRIPAQVHVRRGRNGSELRVLGC